MESLIYTIISVKKDPAKLNNLLKEMKGLSGADLYAVTFNEISAVVSDLNRTDMIADKTNALVYAGVIEILSQQFTLLPMRFGSVMESRDAILQILERNDIEIQKNLQKVENKIEFGLKVFCDSEKLLEKLIANSETEVKTSANSSPEIKNSIFRDYVNQKLKTHRLEELLVNHVDSVIDGLTDHLNGMNAVSKFKKMLTPTTIIDAVILLKKEHKEQLIAEVKAFQNNYSGLNFVLTGPWPPYNFVETNIK
ncbi:MAG: GvpL/GvpF family gas vesicle protein [Mariniphaga sp.]